MLLLGHLETPGCASVSLELLSVLYHLQLVDQVLSPCATCLIPCMRCIRYSRDQVPTQWHPCPWSTGDQDLRVEGSESWPSSSDDLSLFCTTSLSLLVLRREGDKGYVLKIFSVLSGVWGVVLCGSRASCRQRRCECHGTTFCLIASLVLQLLQGL